jgi:CheY-like chemotaxis protein
MERLMNILIIDDVEEDVQLLRSLLIGGGNIVLSCPSIHQAAPIIQQKEIALILVIAINSLPWMILIYSLQNILPTFVMHC